MRITPFHLLDMNEQHTVSLRTRSNLKDLPNAIGAGYMKLGGYLAQHGLTPSAIPFIAYHNMDMNDIDLELAFPVRHAIEKESDFLPGSVRAGLYAHCVCLGPYQELGPVYDEMTRWIDENGFALDGPVYEAYFNGPDGPPEQFLTQITAAIRRK